MSQTQQTNKPIIIEGNNVKVTIETTFTKPFSEAELILMASQMIKAYSNSQLQKNLEALFTIPNY
jgi:hypothetical protein